MFTASFEMWLTALVAVGEVMFSFPTLFSSSTSIANSLGPACVDNVFSARWQRSPNSTTLKCQDSRPSQRSSSRCWLLRRYTSLFWMVSGRSVSLRVVASPRSPTIFPTSEKRFLKCSTSTRNTVEVWSQAKARTETHQKVESTAREHTGCLSSSPLIPGETL